MGKIRLKDLARRMGESEQDLMFKLKSIGVRVEGEDAAIDSEIIQAVLQGRRLTQPREVILRDDAAPAVARSAQPPSRAPAPPQRPPRRPGRKSMIQRRVETRIREIPTREIPVRDLQQKQAPAAQAPVAEKPAPQVQAEAPAQPAPPIKEAPAAAKTAEAKPVETKPETVKPPAKKPEAAAARPTVEKKATAPAKPAAAQKEKPAQPAQATQPTTAKKQPETKTVTAKKPPEKRRRGARLIERPTHPVAPTPPPRPGRRPGMGGPGRPGMRGRPPMGRGRPGRPGSIRTIPGRGRPSEPPVERKPASERGKRRAQRRQESLDQPSTVQLFRDGRPEGPVVITENMTVRDFAEKLGVKAKDLIKTLLGHGIFAGINHQLDAETALTIAEEFGVEVLEATFEEEAQLQHESETGEAEKAPRAPVVTVMGHVDHGKTTLLDRIRSTNVVAGEAGGITQHIGAYHVDHDGREIVFLDTPGHEAFTLMRARGAKVTDIVILVVAADDGVMPQTVEAIDHAKAADVPIVIAINKVDKANANLDRVKKELADHGLMVEDWGGDTVAVPISALQGKGIDEILEMIGLTADLLDLKATPDIPANGVILEARKEIGRGIIATMLVQDGTLYKGDVFVAGSTWGRVRIMTSDRGENLDSAGPATPVEVTGFNDLPSAGDAFQVFTDESKAREIAGFRSHEERQRELAPRPAKMSLEQLFDKMGEDEVQELPVIVKADVHGSVEVLRDTLEKLSTDKVKIKVIHAAVGAISRNNVIFASASNAIIIGFNVRPERNAALLAEKEQVEIRLHTVIYELADEIRQAMAGLLQPTFQEVEAGTAEVRDTFRVPKIGVVAGCYVTDGTIPRNAQIRLLRDNVVVYEGKIASLRRFKDDVSEVRSGFECGIGLDQFQDVKPGDILEAFTREEVAATL